MTVPFDLPSLAPGAEAKVEYRVTVPDTAAEWALEMDAKGLPGTEVVKRWQEITSDLGYEWLRTWGPK